MRPSCGAPTTRVCPCGSGGHRGARLTCSACLHDLNALPASMERPWPPSCHPSASFAPSLQAPNHREPSRAGGQRATRPSGLAVGCGGALITAAASGSWWRIVTSGLGDHRSGPLGDALFAGTELWLLANGRHRRRRARDHAGAGGHVLLVGFLIVRCAGFAARHSPRGSGSAVLGVAVAMTVAYLAPLMATALLFGHPLAMVRGAAVMTPVLGGGRVRAGRSVGYRPSIACPPGRGRCRGRSWPRSWS